MLICPEQQEEKLTKMDLNLFLDKQMAENNGKKVTVASKFRWCPGFGWNTAKRYTLGFSFHSMSICVNIKGCFHGSTHSVQRVLSFCTLRAGGCQFQQSLGGDADHLTVIRAANTKALLLAQQNAFPKWTVSIKHICASSYSMNGTRKSPLCSCPQLLQRSQEQKSVRKSIQLRRRVVN